MSGETILMTLTQAASKFRELYRFNWFENDSCRWFVDQFPRTVGRMIAKKNFLLAENLLCSIQNNCEASSSFVGFEIQLKAHFKKQNAPKLKWCKEPLRPYLKFYFLVFTWHKVAKLKKHFLNLLVHTENKRSDDKNNHFLRANARNGNIINPKYDRIQFGRAFVICLQFVSHVGHEHRFDYDRIWAHSGERCTVNKFDEHNTKNRKKTSDEVDVEK